ncbi:MAG: hypothetical protein VX293_13040 [Candidatus Latescibacterota bacterium]|nr:hypothetical protein [Candidatus Latescibacterota bacterium]
MVDPTEAALGDDLAQRLHFRVAAVLQAHRQQLAGTSGGRDDFFGLGEVGGQGFGDHHVGARLEGGQRCVAVEGRGQGEAGDIQGMVREQLAVVGVVVLYAELGGHLGGVRRVYVGDGYDLRCGQLAIALDVPAPV